MAKVTGWMKTNKLIAILLVGIVVILVGGIAYMGVAKATDKPEFCGSACHEMAPYHTAWSTGPHKDISCVECHVDSSEMAKLQHKIVALKEVAKHFAGDTSFPRATAADVPDARCIHVTPAPTRRSRASITRPTPRVSRA